MVAVGARLFAGVLAIGLQRKSIDLRPVTALSQLVHHRDAVLQSRVKLRDCKHPVSDHPR
jgi:hypothetical protein